MSVSNVNTSSLSQALSAYLKSSSQETASTASSSKTGDSTSTETKTKTLSNLMDVLELGSSASLADYLQYNSNGNYNSSSMLDYMDTDDGLTDLFSQSSDSENNSEDTIFNTVSGISSSVTTENDLIIKKALEKLAAAQEKSTTSTEE